MRLETERLELRSPTTADAPSLQLLYSNPSVLRFLPPRPPMTLDEAEQAIERRMKREVELGYAPFMIRRMDTGEFIGSGGIQPVKDTTDTEIAYHFLPSAWGKGYATEATITILDFGLGRIGLAEIVAVAFADNVGSWRVMEKAGMHFMGMATYHGIEGLRKYMAEARTWAPPGKSSRL